VSEEEEERKKRKRKTIGPTAPSCHVFLIRITRVGRATKGRKKEGRKGKRGSRRARVASIDLYSADTRRPYSVLQKVLGAVAGEGKKKKGKRGISGSYQSTLFSFCPWREATRLKTPGCCGDAEKKRGRGEMTTDGDIALSAADSLSIRSEPLLGPKGCGLEAIKSARKKKKRRRHASCLSFTGTPIAYAWRR